MSTELKIDLAERIELLIADVRERTVTAVNTAMVYTYYEIGRIIVEDEQQGAQRAEYGKAVLKALSVLLSKKFGKIWSKCESSTKCIRRFLRHCLRNLQKHSLRRAFHSVGRIT